MDGNMHGYSGFLDTCCYLRTTDIQMKQDEFAGGTLITGGNDYAIISNSTTQEGTAVISLKRMPV